MSSSAATEADPAPCLSIAAPGSSILPAFADVTIVGAGIAGASLAYLLAALGRMKILVLDRGEVGGGSTQFSAACFRQQFTRVFNVMLNRISFDLYRTEFARVLGYQPLKPVGYLFLKRTAAQMNEALKHAAEQRGWGVKVEALDPDAIRERFPFITVDKIAGAIFGADDGFIRSPASIAAALAEAATARGVDVVQRVELRSIETKFGSVQRIHTSRGTVETPVVVNCAGAWSSLVAASAGSYVPVKPIPRQLTFVNPVPGIPLDTCPMVIVPDGAYFRPEGQTLMLGFAPPDTPASFHAIYDPDLALQTVERLAEYVPALAEAEIRPQGICGLYETTPDHNALIGPDAHVRGLYHCTGFSGHGIMQSPGAAQLMVELLDRGEVSSLHPIVYAPLRADRFERSGGVSWPEDTVI